VRLHQGRRLAAHEVRGPQQPEHRFVAGRLEGPALPNLTLQGG